MESFPYWRVDVFVGDGLRGNPAAIIECKRWLDDSVMQAIACESGGAATAFLIPDATGAADWQVRWFGPRGEIRLCGHGALASAYMLLGRSDAAGLSFRPRHAELLEARRNDSGVELRLPAIETEAGEWPEAAGLLGHRPLETYRSERGYAVFVFESEEDVRGLAPDLAALAALGSHQFICTARGRKSDIVSRVFSGGVEDSATGSAHAVLTPLWTRKLGREEFGAIQASERGGRIECGIEDGDVILGGRCATLIEGRLYLTG